MKPENFSELFAFAQEELHAFLEEFAAYGLDPDPNLQLRKGEGVLCYYDLNDGQIYLVTPDPGDPLGRTQIIFLRMLLGCQSDAELLDLFRLFVPRIIAHELGHYFRHRHGMFSADLWHEEQVANQLADAVTTHRFPPAEKARAMQLVERIIANLAQTIESKHIGTDAYYNPLHAFEESGMLEGRAVENIQLMKHLFSLTSENILKESGVLSEEGLLRLEHREDIINQFNDEYTSNVLQYFYCQLEWMLLDFKSRERHYVQEFMRAHLHRHLALLPAIPQPSEELSDQEICTCFKASQETKSRSAACSRYFYKRYRSLLLSRLQRAPIQNPAHQNMLHKEAKGFLDLWSEQELDPLELMMHLTPASLHHLFPKQIRQTLAALPAFPHQFPCETDRRLWQYVMLQAPDEHAEHTLARLEILDKLDMYRALPAEILLELMRNLLSVYMKADEAIIWEGVSNEDVFIVLEGSLGVVLGGAQRQQYVSTILPGGIVGEMSFFTREPTAARVVALEDSECLVLKSPDFRIFAFKYPTVLMQMGRVLSQRLKASNELRDQNSPT